MDETMLTVSDTGVISSKGKLGTAFIRACAYVNNVLVDTEEYMINVSEDFVRLEMQGEYTMHADTSITLKPVFKYYSSEYRDGKEIEDCEWNVKCNESLYIGDKQVYKLTSDGLIMKLNPELSSEKVNDYISDAEPILCTVNVEGYEDGWHYDSVSFYVTVTECEQHTWEETGRKQPACTDEGVITNGCVRCGAEVSETIPALKHVWDNGTVTRKPTCIENGEKTYHCTRENCTGTRTEEIAATGHTELKDAAVEATCENSGLTEGSHCSVCGKVLVAQKTRKALGHKWGKWTKKSAATVFQAEVQQHTCSRCKKTATKTVGKKLSPILEVSTSSAILKTGQSTKVFCVTKMANGDSVKSWKSSNTAIVKVSGTAKGTCTLAAQKKIGTAKLTVTLKSGKTKTVTVKVQKGAVVTQKITGIPSTLTIQKGKTVTFAPKRNPLTSTDKITFASSNAAVASVTAGGKLTAKAKGTTVITVKAGKAVVKCKVTVK